MVVFGGGAGIRGILGAYIWKLQLAAPWTWWVIVVWLVASFVARRDTPKTMGWRGDNLWRAAKRAGLFFGVSSLLILAAGLFLGMLQRRPEHLMETAEVWRVPGVLLVAAGGTEFVFDEPVAVGV